MAKVVTENKFQFEVALAVSSYLQEVETYEEAFESCKNNFDTALEVAQEELTEAGVVEALDNMGGMKIKVDKFVEFDSGNPSHACGYFLIEVSGSKEDVKTVRSLYTKWMGN